MDTPDLLVAVNVAVLVMALFAAGVLVGRMMNRGEDHV